MFIYRLVRIIVKNWRRNAANKYLVNLRFHLRALDYSYSQRSKNYHALWALLYVMTYERVLNGMPAGLTQGDFTTMESIVGIWLDSKNYFNGSDAQRLRYMLPELHKGSWVHSTPIDWIQAIPDQYQQGDLVVTTAGFTLNG